MAKKKSMIPAAYIFTDKIENRFVNNYTSFIYEEFTLDEALEANAKKLPNLVNAAMVAACSGINTPKTKVFVIYNPNPERLIFAQIADADKLKVLVDSVAKQKQLKDYSKRFQELVSLAHVHQIFSQKFGLLKISQLSKSKDYKTARKKIRTYNTDTVVQLNGIRAQLISAFKKDLCF